MQFIEYESFAWKSSTISFFFSLSLSFNKGTIDTNDNTIFQLAAHVIQAVAGDYTKSVLAMIFVPSTRDLVACSALS